MHGKTRSIVRVVFALVALTALLLLGALALASANTAFFERYYSWLYAANIAIAIVFMLTVGSLVAIIIVRLRGGKFGTRLLAKLAVFFALVGVLPGSIIYLVSLQFVSRSIESWFDVNVETALESGLNLGRGMLDNSLADLRNKSRVVADQLVNTNATSAPLALSRLRDQFSLSNAIIVSPTGTVLAQASSNLAGLLPDDLPTSWMLRQARQQLGYATIEGKSGTAKDELWLRVIVPIPSRYPTSLQNYDRFLQLTQSVPQAFARDAEDVQRGYRNYQEKAFGRTGLRKMYIGTLTLALFLATFLALMLAFVLGNQLTRPLFLLARGTEEVARGDYTPKRESKTNDELGFLTQSFNAMTRQLSEARAAVETNQVALENSNAYLESILANLTAGVFVFDRQFRLTKANLGAERIFKQPFHEHLHAPLEQIAGLAEFAAMVRNAFADREVASQVQRGEVGHWQQQFEIPVAHEKNAIVLLVRGTRLTLAAAETQKEVRTKEVTTKEATTAGYVVVFDDISDIISAQRSLAWGEVARRLAHEIKNPLTPIQLSTERLQIKLSDKLAPDDAAVLKRGTTMIINQVAAMQRMVDDFRDYARTPPAVLQSLQLNDLINEVLALYDVEDSKSIMRLDLAPLPKIYGDATQLRQLIHNLLQNAQDAIAQTEFPRVLIETKTVEYGNSDAQEGTKRLAVRLTVSDNGAGFASGVLARAFEPYVTTKVKGTGLGLAMVKKIVDEHGARIDIRNRSKEANEETLSGAQISILFLRLAG